MKVFECISNYFTLVVTIADELKRNCKELERVRIIEKILHQVDLKFDSIVAAIEETKNLDIMTIEQLHETLQVYEEKLKKK